MIALGQEGRKRGKEEERRVKRGEPESQVYIDVQLPLFPWRIPDEHNDSFPGKKKKTYCDIPRAGGARLEQNRYQRGDIGTIKTLMC